MFSLSEYAYYLPKNLIAQEATHPHHDARIMVVDRENGDIKTETNFWNLDTYIPGDRVIFFNNSKVFKSRIPLKNTRYILRGGKGEVLKEGEIFFLHTMESDTFEALIRPGNKFRTGTRFFIGNSVITVCERTHYGRILHISGDSIFHLMETLGNLPLPPYIAYDESKENDYQTVFAKEYGSVAAPTASLHFTKELLEKIQNEKEYITLHVGLGTFKGIDTEDIRDYAIHHETIEIDSNLFESIAKIKNEGKKVVAVGTTVCRTLESLPYLWKGYSTGIKEAFARETQAYWNKLTRNLEEKDWIHNIISGGKLGNGGSEGRHCLNEDESKGTNKQSEYLSEFGFSPRTFDTFGYKSTGNCVGETITFETSIYITPGYSFNIVDDLITNFHLPESSLLVLISAFLGHKKTMKLYEHAIEAQYRFYSFGDGMYIRGKYDKSE